LFFNFITFLFAVALKDLSFVLSLLGSVTSVLVILFLPATFYLKLFSDGPKWKIHCSKGMLILGAAVLILSLSFNLLKAMEG
jgi:energy-coupling factor transporter transmembrane protein EcfT